MRQKDLARESGRERERENESEVSMTNGKMLYRCCKRDIAANDFAGGSCGSNNHIFPRDTSPQTSSVYLCLIESVPFHLRNYYINGLSLNRSLVHFVIYLFMRSLISSFVRSFTCSFACLLVRSFASSSSSY